MEETKRGFFSPSLVKAAIAYVLALFICSSVFTIVLSIAIGNARGIPQEEMMALYRSGVEKTARAQSTMTVAQGWSNLIAYSIAFICVCFWMRNHLKDDYMSLLANKKKYALWIPLAALGFGVLALGIDHVFGRIIPSSDNQNSIVEMMQSSAAVPVIIATILLAPIVEELIYRKAIFHVFRAYGVIPAYITSIVLFTLPHMLSTTGNIGIWLLQCIPYALCGFMLCFIYDKSGKNIYVSITAHILNNLMAVLFVFL